jgi:4-deoxy-L-threo-5-hexosulose-uronate ketol-isomerase
MEERFQYHPEQVKGMSTEQLRDAFAILNVLQKDTPRFVYTHYDRMVVGGITPSEQSVALPVYEQLKSDYFLERREMGIINVGGTGEVVADGFSYQLNKLDCLYLGKGTKDVSFKSNSSNEPAQFFILSAPAHQMYANTLMKKTDASPVNLGSLQTANERTIYKYIHLDGIKSCQLVMGLTILKEGSVWNTMPAHTHSRRMEAYLYFDVPQEHRVVHFMGQPQETRHLLLGAGDAVVSAPWSIHSGCGTTNYSFIWGMAGENQSFTDMDFVEISELR